MFILVVYKELSTELPLILGLLISYYSVLPSNLAINQFLSHRLNRFSKQKSLSLSDFGERKVDWKTNDWMTDMTESMSLLFPSLTQLETLSLGLDKDYSGLWMALRGQYIKRLCLSGLSQSMDVYHAKLLSKSISSLTQLETLTLHVFTTSFIEVFQFQL
ncbi:hypothetical protein DPMN_161159 [Dreissena polymorpha]|uniref:Uncharacterized protein n=1 Tax=Dreissena polymorpha TaxID=45954 RepID=A0A9D4EP63_DREPO|nr:hypothetical protein DPMN_161159 [Dreissena polymorpha]